ncbi:MAG TPA: sodium-independent anion transporter, partial [Dyella sp.]
QPKVFILRMRLVPIIDASGVHALKVLLERCRRHGIVLIVSGLQSQPQRVVRQMAVYPRDGELYFAEHYEAALALSRRLAEVPRDASGGLPRG